VKLSETVEMLQKQVAMRDALIAELLAERAEN
jgi:hypothetical protein